MTIDETSWAKELSESLGYAVRVEFTRARAAPVQLRHATRSQIREQPELKRGWVVRLHRVFAEAPLEVRAALASWIRVGRRAPRACSDLDAWTEAALARLPARAPRRTAIEPTGQVHDLDVLLEELLQSELPGAFDVEHPTPRATWGRRAPSKTRGRLQLGSYSPHRNLIRVHPVLDQLAVPSWLVRYVLFHELLHAALPTELDEGGRARHHGPDFRRRERAYADYERALEWERAHLGKLLRSARAGKPLKRKSPLGG